MRRQASADLLHWSISQEKSLLRSGEADLRHGLIACAFDGDDLNFTGIASGATTEGVVIYKDTGNPATSPLIYYADTVTGFPMLTSGGAIEVRWDNGAYKIFSL